MPVETGDGVIYGEYDGTQVKIDGVTHSLIRDSDILVKYKGEKLTLDSVEAVNDYVLVYVETREAQSEGGLFLASTSEGNKRPSTGKVVKVGPGRMAEDGSLMPMTVSEGEEVKFRDYAGNEVTIGDDEYSVVQMADIIAKF
jgi:chaperonin GroES